MLNVIVLPSTAGCLYSKKCYKFDNMSLHRGQIITYIQRNFKILTSIRFSSLVKQKNHPPPPPPPPHNNNDQ